MGVHGSLGKTRKLSCTGLLLLLGLLLASIAQAAPSSSSVPELPLERYELSNGMRVVLNQDHTSPRVSVCVTYDVGSKDERRGQSGFAHLFEHLMFQGSRNVPKGDHFRLLVGRGGRVNGTTTKDRTNYYETLPASELELALWLEADRMKALALTRKKFENQRAVVEEEYRKNYSGRTYALGRIRLHELAYEGYWPYQHPTIGSLEDLDAAKYAWARRFHQEYYSPENAVLSISGDFSLVQAKQWIEKYFGPIPPGPEANAFEPLSKPPRHTSERLSVMEDASAKTPGVYVGWLIPQAHTKEHYALELAAEVLAGGDSGRLYQSLVLDKASAMNINAWTSGLRGIDLFTVKFQVSKLSSVDTNFKWLDGELKRLRLIGPSDDELERAKARKETRLLRQLQSSQTKAILLGQLEALWGDANLLSQQLRAYRQLDKAQVRAAASKYLQDTQRSVVEIYPPGWVRDIGPAIITKTYVVKKGDNLTTIARQYGTTVSSITKANRISSKRTLYPGQRLLVTVGSGASHGPRKVTKVHTVKKGDNLISIAKKYGTTVKAITIENKISRKRAIFPGQKLSITIEVGGKKTPSGKTKSTQKRAKGRAKSHRKARKAATKSKSRRKAKPRTKKK